jgi:hypothetical protein
MPEFTRKLAAIFFVFRCHFFSPNLKLKMAINKADEDPLFCYFTYKHSVNPATGGRCFMLAGLDGLFVSLSYGILTGILQIERLNNE